MFNGGRGRTSFELPETIGTTVSTAIVVKAELVEICTPYASANATAFQTRLSESRRLVVLFAGATRVGTAGVGRIVLNRQEVDQIP